MKQLIIFDFDNTLFRTREFWRAHLFPSYESIGIDRNILEAVFSASTTKRVDYFVPKYFIDELLALVRGSKLNREKLNNIFKKQVCSPSVRSFYYPHALELLNKAKNSRNDMVLISYGDKKFKEIFFKYCSIYDFFSKEEVYITNKPKVKLFKLFSGYDKFIIINDVLDETENMINELSKEKVSAHAFLLDYNKAHSTNIINTSIITLCSSLKEIKIQ